MDIDTADLINTFEIGKIVNAHGIKGDIRVMPCTDDPTRFERLKEIYVYGRQARAVQTYPIERVWYHKNFVMLKLQGVDSMTAAEALKHCSIRVPRADAIPLRADEYFIGDLYDAAVFDESGAPLGTLTDILQTGANDVYAITNTEGKTILIPAIKQCVLQVDTAQKRLTVRLLPGLEWV